MNKDEALRKAERNGHKVFALQWDDDGSLDLTWFTAPDEAQAEQKAIDFASPELDGIEFCLLDEDEVALKTWSADEYVG